MTNEIETPSPYSKDIDKSSPLEAQPRNRFSFEMPAENDRNRILLLFGGAAGLAFLMSFFIEFLTLVGAPYSSPLSGDWNFARVFIYFLINLGIFELIAAAIHLGRFDYLVDFWSGHGTYRAARLGIEVVAGILIFLIGGFIGSALGARLGIISWRCDIIGSVALVCLALLVVHFTTICRNLEWGYLIVALGMGTILCFSVPASTHTSWDDNYHYDSANAVSYVLDAQYTGADGEASVPASKVEMEVKNLPAAPSPDPFGLDDETYAKLDASYSKYADQYKVIYSGTEWPAGTSYCSSTGFIGHIPNAIGLWLGRIFFDDFTHIFVFGKLLGMLSYVLLVFFGIRHLKSGKAIVGLIALIPTGFFQATCYTYDSVPTSMTLFSLSYYIGEVQRPERKLGAWEIGVILLSFYIGACVKTVYLMLGIILLFMPTAKFKTSVHRIVYTAGAAIVFLIGAWMIFDRLYRAVTVGGLTDSRGGDEVNAGKQTLYILDNPIEYIKTVINYTFKYYLNPGMYSIPISPYEGNKLSYFYYIRWTTETTGESFSMYQGITISWMITLFVQSFFDRQVCDRNYSGPVAKVTQVIGLAIAYFAVCSSMYIIFTPVGLDTINGLQNRYLLPLAVPFFLMLLNIGAPVKTSPVKRALMFLIPAIALWACEYYFVFFSNF